MSTINRHPENLEKFNEFTSINFSNYSGSINAYLLSFSITWDRFLQREPTRNELCDPASVGEAVR